MLRENSISGGPTKGESIDAHDGGGSSRSSDEPSVMEEERRGWAGSIACLVNWETGMSEALQLSPCGGDAATEMAGTSRMNREVHVRNCGGLVVKFHRSTRPPS